jgi:hypothetical protein
MPLRYKCMHTSRKSPAAIENWALGGRSAGLMSGKETPWVWCSGSRLFTYWCTHGNTWYTFVPRHLESQFPFSYFHCYCLSLQSSGEIWGSHSSEDVNCGLLGCDTVQSCRWLPTFRRNTLLLVITNVSEEHTASIFRNTFKTNTVIICTILGEFSPFRHDTAALCLSIVFFTILFKKILLVIF